MNLVPKLSLTFIAGMSLVLAINGYLRVKREVGLFESDRIRDGAQVGKALAVAVSTVWQTDGEDRALSLVTRANTLQGRLRVHWLPFDDPNWRSLVEDTPGDSSRTFVGAGASGGAERFTIVPVTVAAATPGALELSEPLEPEERYIHRTILDTLATTLTLDGVCAALAMLVGSWVVGRPMGILVEKARRVGAGDFGGPLVLKQRDEVSRLASEMNGMCDRLVAANERAAAELRARVEMLEQLRHADRLMTVGKLASGVAHELGTPLNVIEARATMIANGETTGDESVTCARAILRGSERMTRIIRQLLAFARPGSLERSRCDLVAVAQRTVDLLQPLARKRNVKLRVEARGPVFAQADAGQIEQAITNLTMNATQAMEHEGQVELRVDPRGITSASR
jgi:two-component system, NtrC family, sensor kinase